MPKRDQQDPTEPIPQIDPVQPPPTDPGRGPGFGGGGGIVDPGGEPEPTTQENGEGGE